MPAWKTRRIQRIALTSQRVTAQAEGPCEDAGYITLAKNISLKNLYYFSQASISSSDFDSLRYLIDCLFKTNLSSNFSNRLSSTVFRHDS